jgi:hypothetical protein
MPEFGRYHQALDAASVTEIRQSSYCGSCILLHVDLVA